MSADVPDADAVVRYCSAARHQDGRVRPRAFYFKNGDPYVSVNWLEMAHREYGEPSAIESVRAAMSRNITLRRSGILAELNVGDAKRSVRRFVGKDALRVKHEPDDDASHAGMSGYNVGDVGSDTLYKGVAAELALLASDTTHQAIQ